MQEYVLCCGSTADLTAERLRERNIEYIPFHFSLDGKEYTDDLGKSISYPEFYAAMARGAMTRTSQTNTDEFCRRLPPGWKRAGTWCTFPFLREFPGRTTPPSSRRAR